jgi:23S rRNA (uridine2552-2'-O)-methyltransferase
VRFLQLDIDALDAQTLGDDAKFDVVLSDMAPKTSGQRQSDQYLSYELYMRALSVAARVLGPGGQFVGKIFQGKEFEQARAETRRLFRQVRIVKPEASRDESYEIFLVGSGLRDR